MKIPPIFPLFWPEKPPFFPFFIVLGPIEMWPVCLWLQIPMYLSKIPFYLPKIPLYLPQIRLYWPHIPLYLHHIPLHWLKIQSLAQNTAVFATIDLFILNYLLWQCEARAKRTYVKSHCGGRVFSQTLPQCQLGDCQVHLTLHDQLSALGSLLVDIGFNLHSDHFAVKFSSAFASENLTAKCTLCFNSIPPKSIFKSAKSRCTRLGRLENGLRRT